MIQTIALVLGALLAAFLGYAATRPNTLRVHRSATVNAPPEAIYPLIEDFRRWSAWSPYEKRDPRMVRAFTGAERGPGAAYAWEGNAQAGKGRMEITAAEPYSRVAIRLDFEKPFRSRNHAEFTLEPRGDATVVTWSMTAPSPFVMRVMGIFVDLDRLIGQDFEVGLGNLKSIAERDAAARPAPALAG